MVDSRYERLPKNVKKYVCSELHQIVASTSARPFLDFADPDEKNYGRPLALYAQIEKALQFPYYNQKSTLKAAKASFALSYAYLVGFGVPISSVRACEYLMISAALGLPRAISIVKRFHDALGQEIPAAAPIRLLLVLGTLNGSLESSECLRDLDPDLYADTLYLLRHHLMPTIWFPMAISETDKREYPMHNLPALKQIIEENNQSVDDLLLFECSFSLLHVAAVSGNLEAVQFLVNKLQADVNKQNKDGATPILLACRSGHHEIIEFLLNCGSDVSIADNLHMTPLHWLVSVDDEHCTKIARKMVAQGAKLDVQTRTRTKNPWLYNQFHMNSTPLVWALFRKRLSLFTELHQLGAKMIMGDAPLPIFTPRFRATSMR